MRQGTTPTHVFNVDIDTSTIEKVRVSYVQRGRLVLTKETGHCSVTKNAISIKLTQEETLLFSANENVQIQLHILTTEKDAIVSNVVTVPCEVLLNKEVLK